MARYRFVGDSPRSLPAYGIDRVEPGDYVETVEELDHPDFKLAERKAGAKAEPAASKSDAPVSAPSPEAPKEA